MADETNNPPNPQRGREMGLGSGGGASTKNIVVKMRWHSKEKMIECTEG